MKVFLSYRDRDFDLAAELPPNAEVLSTDLGLPILLGAMAAGDRFLFDVAKTAILVGLPDVEAIRYRQEVLADCLEYPDVVREMYRISVAAVERERRSWMFTARHAESLLHRSVELMGLFLELLWRLRGVAEANVPSFRSPGFARLFEELIRELDDPYLKRARQHLSQLRLRDGVRVSARLGPGNVGTDYVLNRRSDRPSLRERIGLREPDSHVWDLPERDDAGAEALSEMRGRAIALAATALAQSSDHILNYFAQLRAELAFYIGCLNLRDALERAGTPICLPGAEPPGTGVLSARGLYDAGLRLSMEGAVIGSDLEADGKQLVVVTGANRGGKSTFLRSLGLAQLMMQSGMFVPAISFQADVRSGIFTHFRRGEEANRRSGKMDEELARMSWIVDQVRRNGLVLLNESFASTNEREGSEIGRQIVGALLDEGVQVAYVTHLFDLASRLHQERGDEAAFLRAERLPDGRRTFRLVPGEPLATSHGQDIYVRVFGVKDEPPAAAGQPDAYSVA